MKLEELFLRKEELPIRRETDFVVPIYPALLREDIQLDSQIAHRVFAQVAQEYLLDLEKYTETMQDEKKKEYYQQMLRRDATVVPDKNGEQTFRGWQDLVRTSDTGFATVLAQGPSSGGSLYYNEKDRECAQKFIFSPLVLFSEEKFLAYSSKKINFSGAQVQAYGYHNIDTFPQALFLRNWAMLYLNSALRELEMQGKL